MPQITALFWLLKLLSTAMGESTSDAMVRLLGSIPAVLAGFALFVLAMVIQLTRQHYVAWSYWLAVGMVGVFGTQCADVLHVAIGVPYIGSAALYAVCLAIVFFTWWRIEGTLSIHRIDTARREIFYWATVVATFALGTATGDLTAVSFTLGYLGSAVLFAVVIVVPALARWRGWLNPIAAFWFAYVVTRPLGASLADWIGKPVASQGLGVGDAPVAGGLILAMVVLVIYLSVGRTDVIDEA